jgi:methylglyoxal synthase
VPEQVAHAFQSSTSTVAFRERTGVRRCPGVSRAGILLPGRMAVPARRARSRRPGRSGDLNHRGHLHRVAAPARGLRSCFPDESYEEDTVTQALALIAHDNKKADLVAWATFNRGTLSSFRLVATGHTARLLRVKVGLEVEELLSGAEGGDAQIAARVATGLVQAVFFFVDPLTAQPHDPDIRALLRVCNVHNVPLATNVATADAIIATLSGIATPDAGHGPEPTGLRP